MNIFNKSRKTASKPVSSGIYIDIVKRPVRHRPVPVAVLKAAAKRQKRNQAARQKRAQLKQLNSLQVIVKTGHQK